MVSYEDLDIKTYTVGEKPADEEANLIENKFLFTIQLEGFTDHKVDPRAAIFEFGYKRMIKIEKS